MKHTIKPIRFISPIGTKNRIETFRQIPYILKNSKPFIRKLKKLGIKEVINIITAGYFVGKDNQAFSKDM